MTQRKKCQERKDYDNIAEIMSKSLLINQRISSKSDLGFQYECFINMFLSGVPTAYELRNLLCLLLLDLNRFNELHTKLESFPGKEIQNNVYIKHTITEWSFIYVGNMWS